MRVSWKEESQTERKAKAASSSHALDFLLTLLYLFPLMFRRLSQRRYHYLSLSLNPWAFPGFNLRLRALFLLIFSYNLWRSSPILQHWLNLHFLLDFWENLTRVFLPCWRSRSIGQVRNFTHCIKVMASTLFSFQNLWTI